MKKTVGILIVLVVVLVGTGLALNWEPDRSVADLSARWAAAPSTFVDVMGMQVHLRDQGPQDDPTPIVLLHGTSASLHTWEGWVNELKGSRRVITFDLPGFGLTGPFPDGDYHMEHYVAFVTGLLDKLGVNRFVVGGNSLGGAVAWNVALAQPTRVERLILVDAGGYPDPDAVMPIGFKLAQIPVLKPVIERLMPRSVVESSLKDAYGNPAKVDQALVDRYFDLALRAGNRGSLVDRFQDLKPGEGYEQIASLQVPTLIIWGDLDTLIPPASAVRFKEDIKGSELAMFKGLGHVPQEEDPVATVKRVKAFL